MSMSKGFGLAASVELGKSGGERQDRTPPSRSPKRPFVRVDELGGQISGNAWRAFNMDKTGFEPEIGFGDFEHLAVPSSPSRRRRGLSRRSHLSSKQMPKKGRTRADSLMREKFP
jgi:hypothetical protein